MKNVLLVCDRPNWAYDSIAQALVKHNFRDDLSFKIVYIKGGDPWREDALESDEVLVFGWQCLGVFRWHGFKYYYPFLKPGKILTGIHSHHSWDGKKSMPDNNPHPPRKLIRLLNRCRRTNAVSKRLYNIFHDSGLKNISYTPNGVDTELFRPVKPLNNKGKLIVGYSGSLKHDWRKGISQFIEPACREAGAGLKKAMPTADNYVPLDEMASFYNEIDVYLCASSSEGFSLSVLEASACGRPVISTRVGGCEDLIVDGENGFLVKRDLSSIVEKLNLLDGNRDLLASMGKRNREIVEERWSWDIRVRDWIDFIAGPENQC